MQLGRELQFEGQPFLDFQSKPLILFIQKSGKKPSFYSFIASCILFRYFEDFIPLLLIYSRKKWSTV